LLLSNGAEEAAVTMTVDERAVLEARIKELEHKLYPAPTGAHRHRKKKEKSNTMLTVRR
jgi:hypothetical protein